MPPTLPKPKTPPATPAAKVPETAPVDVQTTDDHTGATDAAVGDRTGPGAGFDQEPQQDKDKGGVAPS